MYKNTQAARKIIEAQDECGLWGLFHGLSEPTNKQLTTEQALRRLQVLGFTIEDDCIKKSVAFMEACLLGHEVMPDRREKSHNWDLFQDLMLATWIRRITLDSEPANKIAERWARVIGAGFVNKTFDAEAYNAQYFQEFGEKIYGGIFQNPVNLYQVSLVQGLLEADVEKDYVDYILNNEGGIYYYGYQKRLIELPDQFASKQTTKFLACIELLLGFKSSHEKLAYVFDWLDSNKNGQGLWDMTGKAKDKIHLPLSDSWRNKEDRVKDCSYLICNIYEKMERLD